MLYFFRYIYIRMYVCMYIYISNIRIYKFLTSFGRQNLSSICYYIYIYIYTYIYIYIYIHICIYTDLYIYIPRASIEQTFLLNAFFVYVFRFPSFILMVEHFLYNRAKNHYYSNLHQDIPRYTHNNVIDSNPA